MSLILFNLFIIVIYFFVTIYILSKICASIYKNLINYNTNNSRIDKIKNIICVYSFTIIYGYSMYFTSAISNFYKKDSLYNIAELTEIIFADPLQMIFRIMLSSLIYSLLDYYLFYGKGLSKMLLDKNLKK